MPAVVNFVDLGRPLKRNLPPKYYSFKAGVATTHRRYFSPKAE